MQISLNHTSYIHMQVEINLGAVLFQIMDGKEKGHCLSINQSNFYSDNIPGRARLSGATAKSVFNSKIEETVP